MTAEMLPSLSLISVSLNAGKHIQDCLQSVERQGVDCQRVFIDGGSTDDTVEHIRGYAKDGDILVSEPDKGIYDAMNKGIRLATGEVVGILNADDFYARDDVLSTIQTLFSDPTVDASYADLIYVAEDSTDRIVRCWKSGTFHYSRFYWGWMPPHPTFFVRRSLYEQYGGFSLDLGSAADYELMLRFLLKHKAKAAYVPEVIVKMRTGGVSNRTLKNRLLANRLDRRAWEVNGLRPYPWTLYLKPLRKIGQWFVR